MKIVCLWVFFCLQYISKTYLYNKEKEISKYYAQNYNKNKSTVPKITLFPYIFQFEQYFPWQFWQLCFMFKTCYYKLFIFEDHLRFFVFCALKKSSTIIMGKELWDFRSRLPPFITLLDPTASDISLVVERWRLEPIVLGSNLNRAKLTILVWVMKEDNVHFTAIEK